MGGAIIAHSEPGQGAEFEIFCPRLVDGETQSNDHPRET
jgi:signal transduction histidine kinase